jgi:hypothetical protein
MIRYALTLCALMLLAGLSLLRIAPGDAAVLSPSPSAGDTLPPDVQSQLDKLSAGTVIVPCNSASARLPEGIVPSVSGSWWAAHPAWRLLLHGYCADNPNATPEPVVVPNLP